MRTIWQTKTAKGASISALAGVIILIGPQVINITKRSMPTPKAQANIEDAGSIIMSLAGLFAVGGSAGAVLGRAAANDKVASPAWMPGPNITKEGGNQ